MSSSFCITFQQIKQFTIFLFSEVIPKRHFYYNGQSLPLTIESSDRVSHQLASHILKILLEEVLGYDHVQLRSGYNSLNATEILNRLAGCSQQTG